MARQKTAPDKARVYKGSWEIAHGAWRQQRTAWEERRDAAQYRSEDFSEIPPREPRKRRVNLEGKFIGKSNEKG